ncbi:MAG: hypothetical protein WC623_18365 [Pedobacter sp.]|uniref:hypothetical protein n=1 Tax=Pedobacter sp. TaxID=1411316 RepID=UPI003564D637
METNSNENSPGSAHVPDQQTGSEMNAVEKIEMASEMEAVHFFETVKERLLDVNRWTEIAGGAMSEFLLTDENGNLVQRKATGGDHIRIDIPGPGTHTGGGYDWVIIEDINAEVSDNAEVLSITARPSTNPLTISQDTAHFLTEKATSTFQVKRIGNMIYAEEHGRNEIPNTYTGNILDNLRNTFVGWGAKVGFSYPQWKALVKGLLNQSS